MSAAPDPNPALAAVTRPGTPIRLYLPDGASAFVSSILEAEGGLLAIAPVRPSHGNLVLERLLGVVRIEAMVGGVPHVAITRVRSVTADGLILDLPSRVERVQRRRFFRVPINDSIGVHLGVGGSTRIRQLLDLSGCGCAVRPTPEDADLAVGDRIPVLSLPLSEGQVFVCGAVVRRAEPREWGGGEGRVLGLEFQDISPRAQERLVSWIADQERRSLRALAPGGARVVPDVVVLLHDSERNIRLKPGSSLNETGVSVAVCGDEDDLQPGARHELAELRVGGQLVSRGPVRVERVQVTRAGPVATLTFLELSIEGRARLAEVLRMGG